MALLYPLLLLAAVQPHDCYDEPNQAAINECAARAFTESDVALNAAVGVMLAHVRALDADYDSGVDDRPGAYARFDAAQTAWTRFRDAHCTVAGYEERGGSMETMIYEMCRAELNRARAAELRAMAGE